ncbi:hypothetical protein MBM_07474 [Drepanopeziza brunnea f. sp. 'multigermtubi' MB_m1]|uniref:Uncharacterized protein n=1 Tax=Marssonina brunnea f. sp. multigermtubi (strain MB_m1) TaxID=1072389 RepID=K1XP41_MARBU|nr:uncharacterized protein MBM_07474 [Drepanopeziza brunnea f. sp. 'multigermtubi' MB_m1]EKD14244.1 hypothetical protein MBM_07474 [Drepanopeziza brunnea f. sp. 'multigermtubi' MB_m1]
MYERVRLRSVTIDHVVFYAAVFGDYNPHEHMRPLVTRWCLEVGSALVGQHLLTSTCWPGCRSPRTSIRRPLASSQHNISSLSLFWGTSLASMDMVLLHSPQTCCSAYSICFRSPGRGSTRYNQARDVRTRPWLYKPTCKHDLHAGQEDGGRKTSYIEMMCMREADAKVRDQRPGKRTVKVVIEAVESDRINRYRHPFLRKTSRAHGQRNEGRHDEVEGWQRLDRTNREHEADSVKRAPTDDGDDDTASDIEEHLEPDTQLMEDSEEKLIPRGRSELDSQLGEDIKKILILQERLEPNSQLGEEDIEEKLIPQERLGLDSSWEKTSKALGTQISSRRGH